jgi:hypothetical protein
MKVTWSYLGGEPLDILDGTWETAVRREWWYAPHDTYVYQLRDGADGTWGDVYGEFEDEPLPPDVQEVLRVAGFTLTRTTDDLVVGSQWRHKKRGSEYKVSSLRQLQCGIVTGLGPRDGDSLVCYDSTDPECPPEFRVWARPVREFLDGRFELL